MSVVPIVEGLLSLLRRRPPSSRWRMSEALVNAMSLENPPLSLSNPVVVVPAGRRTLELAVALMLVMFPEAKTPPTGEVFETLAFWRLYPANPPCPTMPTPCPAL